MKKSIFRRSALSITLVLGVVALSGCSHFENSISDGFDSESDNSTSVFDNNSVDEQNSSQDYNFEQNKPDGDPTFLTAPDGTPIYTSEITGYQNNWSDTGIGLEQYSLDTFNKETFTDIGCPVIICEGFAYGFIPRFNINVSEAPDKFTDFNGVQMYSGEELPPSNEYFKIIVGDKFGGLTVKSARTGFSNYKAQFYAGNPESVSGIYLTEAEIEYEGEVEMTGCIQVMKTEGYETEGNLWFYPDGDCVSKIPMTEYRLDNDREIICHMAESHFGAYGELNEIVLGNMYDYDIDFDGLKPGDDFVRVKLTIKNPVVSASNGYMGCNGEPVAVTVLE